MGYFKKALQLNPRDIDLSSIYCHIGVCLKDLEQYEQAIEFLDQAKAYNDAQKEIYNVLGFCYFKLKEHHKAIEAFERAIEIDPGSGIDYANIGSNLRELGFYSEAIKLYQMALELDPTIEFARDNIERLSHWLKDQRIMLDFADTFKKYETLVREWKSRSTDPGSQSGCIRCVQQCSDCCHAVFDLSLIESVYINYHFYDRLDKENQEQVLERAEKADRQFYRIKRKLHKMMTQGEKRKRRFCHSWRRNGFAVLF